MYLLQSLSDKNEDFKQFLNGLGWVVDPASHFGFKGKLHPISDHGSGDPKPLYIDAQIPFKPFVYFANLNTEVAFVLPTLKQSKSLSSSSSLRSVESSDVGPESELLFVIFCVHMICMCLVLYITLVYTCG